MPASTVSFTGTGSIQAATTFPNLTIAATANVTLQANIGINDTLSLSGTSERGNIYDDDERGTVEQRGDVQSGNGNSFLHFG